VPETLSVTIITLNEERNIGTCIRSVAAIAEQVVVIDSGSKDGTEAVVKELGAEFHYNPWPGHLEQKNVAIDRSNGSWVLSLDADEWIDEALAAEIRRLVNLDGDGADGFEIDRKTMFLGKFMRAWSPDWNVRLFRRDFGRFGGTNPHDLVIMKPGSKTKRCTNRFYHDSYKSTEQYISRLNAYTSIAATALHAQGKCTTFTKLFLSPLWMFVKMLVLKAAWLDGYRGIFLSLSSSYYVFLKYAKLWEFENLGPPSVSTRIASSEHEGRSGAERETQ